MLAYRGRPERGELSALAGAELTVVLADPNGQEAGRVKVTTNGFGTAAGEFAIPPGRLLGGWRLKSLIGPGADLAHLPGLDVGAELASARVEASSTPTQKEPSSAGEGKLTEIGAARVLVEEYRRPTFEVSFQDPAEPLRLNRPARFTGEARYYFGRRSPTATRASG